MEKVTLLVERYGVLAVFLNVLLDEGGLPIPSYPLLAVAGALSFDGHPPLLPVAIAALLASALADNTWFWMARRHGRKVLAQLCRISISPDNCVRKTETMFLRIGPAALFFVKFIPGLSNITVSLAGVTGVSPFVFVPFQLLGASIYLGLPIVLGRLFHQVLGKILHAIDAMGKLGLAGIAAAFAIYILVRWIDRQRFMRELRMARITVPELASLLASDSKPILLDVRLPSSRAHGLIPGALSAHPKDMHPCLENLTREQEIVIYCDCPHESAAATAANHLRRAGFKRIRPLLGGFEAWIEAGYTAQPFESADRSAI
jgi:membrane protein DedA with SNARE-associated domain/rhodanese-related sulfurtransferase